MSSVKWAQGSVSVPWTIIYLSVSIFFFFLYLLTVFFIYVFYFPVCFLGMYVGLYRIFLFTFPIVVVFYFSVNPFPTYMKVRMRVRILYSHLLLRWDSYMLFSRRYAKEKCSDSFFHSFFSSLKVFISSETVRRAPYLLPRGSLVDMPPVSESFKRGIPPGNIHIVFRPATRHENPKNPLSRTRDKTSHSPSADGLFPTRPRQERAIARAPVRPSNPLFC